MIWTSWHHGGCLCFHPEIAVFCGSASQIMASIAVSPWPGQVQGGLYGASATKEDIRRQVYALGIESVAQFHLVRYQFEDACSRHLFSPLF